MSADVRAYDAESCTRLSHHGASIQRLKPGCRFCIQCVASDITRRCSQTPRARINSAKQMIGWWFFMMAVAANGNAQSLRLNSASSTESVSFAGAKPNVPGTINRQSKLRASRERVDFTFQSATCFAGSRRLVIFPAIRALLNSAAPCSYPFCTSQNRSSAKKSEINDE